MDLLKQLAQDFSQNFLTAALTNGGIALLLFWALYRWLYPRLQHWRIPLRQQWDNAQVRRELKNALYTLSVSALLSSLLLYWSSQGYTQLYTDFWAHPYWSAGGFFLFLFIDDAWFYWTHRLLHHPRIYRHVHLEHHKSVDVIPLTSLSFHWLEPLLLTSWIVPAAFFIPTYVPALIALQLWGFLDNLKSHLGLEIYPAWWIRSPLGWLTSSTHHNLHHSHVKGNYGVHFRFWDRLMGTEFENYEATFDAVQDRKTKRKHKPLTGPQHQSH